jgi:hypothetical protein
MKYIDIDLGENDTYYNAVMQKNILKNIEECTKATKTKFGESANPINPTPEQKAFMENCLREKKQTSKPNQLESNSSPNNGKKNNVLIYTAIALGVVAIYMFIIKR